MMNQTYPETIMRYLTGRRLSSLGNLAGHFQQSVEEMTPMIRVLELQKRLRLSGSRCAGECGTCHVCSTDNTQPPLSERTIAISLEFSELEP